MHPRLALFQEFGNRIVRIMNFPKIRIWMRTTRRDPEATPTP
jgi:hypothetical protein